MSAGEASFDRDTGAQPERTRFAWRRSTLTFAVAVALGVRHALYGSGGVSPTEALAAVAGVLAWLAFLVLAHRRIAAMEAEHPPPMNNAVVLLAGLCILALVMVGVMLLW